MPKRVDHAARRTEMARAVLRIGARDGLAAVSIGTVAHELGISKGLVQHYFTGKADLLALAASTLRLDLRQHIADATAGHNEPRELLRQILLALVGLGRQDPPTLLLAGHAFLASTGSDRALRELYRAGNTEAEHAIAELLSAAGSISPDRDMDARMLLSIAGGLADALFIGQTDEHAAAATLNLQLDRIGIRA